MRASNKGFYRSVIVFTALLLLTSTSYALTDHGVGGDDTLVLAQQNQLGVEPPSSPTQLPDTPRFSDHVSTAPSNGLSGMLSDSASPVAVSVLNTVDKFLSDPGQELGNALNGLLGNGGASNLSES